MRPRDLLSRIVKRSYESSGIGKELRCSFCGLPHDQVKKLVSGPGVYICDACVELAVKIMAEPEETRH